MESQCINLVQQVLGQHNLKSRIQARSPKAFPRQEVKVGWQGGHRRRREKAAENSQHEAELTTQHDMGGHPSTAGLERAILCL